MPPTTVSTWVRRLSARRQITRKVNPDDGRSASLEVTSAGRSAIDDAQPIFRRLLDEVEEALGARRRASSTGSSSSRRC